MLDHAIESLNSHSKCEYVTNDAYGYSQLAVHEPNSVGCISNMSLGNTKKELYYQIQFALDWIRKENDPKNHKDFCRHRGELNYFEGTKDMSLIDEYKDEKKKSVEYQCRGCHKKFSQPEFEQSHEPITYHQITEERDRELARREKN